jgi:hypothetical protein
LKNEATISARCFAAILKLEFNIADNSSNEQIIPQAPRSETELGEQDRLSGIGFKRKEAKKRKIEKGSAS